MKPYIDYILKFLLVFSAYYISGRVGLLLTVPPGQATAIWPASGVALAACLLGGPRYLPAVFLGAMGTSLYHPDVIDMKAIMIALPIASGAALQAACGSYLVKKYISFPNHLETVPETLKLLLWGGVIACMINASIGTAVVFTAGFIESSDVYAHLYTWWIGDVLGVVAFTPALLVILAADVERLSISKIRKLAVSGTVIVMFVAVAILFTFAKAQNQLSNERMFISGAHEVSDSLHERMSIYMSTLVALESFFNASEYVSAEEFETFTRRLFDNAPGLSGLSWIPKVTRENREQFELSIREQGYPSFEIKRRFSEGNLRRSEERDFYLPLAYTQPYETNKAAHGFDVYSKDPLGDNVRIYSLNSAAESGMSRATGRFPIVQNENNYGFIVYHPVYDHMSSKGRSADNLIGYINGIFLLPTLMQSIDEKANELGMNIILKDKLGINDYEILYDSRTIDHKEDRSLDYDFKNTFYFEKGIPVGGRLWELYFIKNKELVAETYNWALWSILTGGTLFTSLAGLFILFVSARSDLVSRLVTEKTKELENSQKFLKLMMDMNPDFVFVKDKDFKIVTANESFVNIYPEEMRDKVIGYTTAESYNKKEADEFLKNDRYALEHGYSEVEETILFPDGKQRTLVTKKVGFTDENGDRFLLGIAHDVTARKKSEEKLKALNLELEEFAYRTSHDIRAPIASSIGLLEATKRMIEKDKIDVALESIGHIEKSMAKLDTLIQDILNLTETRNREEVPKAVDLQELVEESIEKVSHIDGFENIRFESEFKFKKKVNSLELRVRNIIDNLISNAVKYADKEKKDSFVIITTRQKKGRCVIRVEDNGLGIPNDQQEHVFGIFQRFHPQVSFGSGLGLYLIKKSAEVINAEITYEDTENGSAFELSLPLEI